MGVPQPEDSIKDNIPLTDQKKLDAYQAIIPSLTLPVLQRIKNIGEENISDLFPWFDGTRESFLSALETLEDLNEAIRHGNNYM